MAVLCRDGQVHGASAMAGLAAALVAKGAAETMESVCRKSIMCERIGDARHRPCAEASSVPLDYLAQAQDTLRYEGIDDSAERLGASAQRETPWSWSWRGTIKETQMDDGSSPDLGLARLGSRSASSRRRVPEQVNRCFSCSAVSSSSRFAQASATCIPAMKRPRHSRTVL